jgi:hypothetical protein
MRELVDGLLITLAMLVSGAIGSMLTIEHYRRLANRQAAYEEEAAQVQDVLAAAALIRRMRANRHQGPATPGPDCPHSW